MWGKCCLVPRPLFSRPGNVTDFIGYREGLGKSRTGTRQGELEFFPQKSGVPVVVGMLSFIKTEVNVNREVGMRVARISTII